MTTAAAPNAPGEPTADHTLVALAVVAPLLLVGTLVTGRSELAALAAPFAVALVLAVVTGSERPVVDVELHTDDERRVEGDVIEVTIVVQVHATIHRVDVALEHPPELQPVGDTAARWSLCPRRDRPERLAVTLRALRWGAYPLGPVWVRAYGRFGLVRWTAPAVSSRLVRVVPTEVALRTALAPLHTGAALGTHRSRARGDGFDYATSRRFGSGDRLRSINWRVTARHGELWANDRHPDRNGDIVIFVDTFADSRSGGAVALKRAVLAAWSMANAQLKGRDRVGVVTFGGYPAWLTPGLGERAKALVLDRLLSADTSWTEVERPLDVVGPRALPAAALVVVLTPLHDERIVALVGGLVRRGLDVAVLVIDTSDLVAKAPVMDAARRLWDLERQRRADTVCDLGCPLAVWTHDGVLADAVVALEGAIALRRPRPR